MEICQVVQLYVEKYARVTTDLDKIHQNTVNGFSAFGYFLSVFVNHLTDYN